MILNLWTVLICCAWSQLSCLKYGLSEKDWEKSFHARWGDMCLIRWFGRQPVEISTDLAQWVLKYIKQSRNNHTRDNIFTANSSAISNCINETAFCLWKNVIKCFNRWPRKNIKYGSGCCLECASYNLSPIMYHTLRLNVEKVLTDMEMWRQ